MNSLKQGPLNADKPDKDSYILGELLRNEIKKLVKQSLLEMNEATDRNGQMLELLTPDELAKRLKVSVSWVYDRSRQNEIPTYRIGRYVRFNIREVLDFMKQLTC